MDLRKLDMKIERLLRGLAGRAGGAPAPEAALEVRMGVLEALDEKVAETGCAAGESFPFNRVEIELAVRSRDHRELVEAVFADRAGLAREVSARIASAGPLPPAGLQVEVRTVDAAAGGETCRIRLARAERAVPPAILTVTHGQAARTAYTLARERIHIGRGAEVMDAAGRLVRRNDVAFAAGEESVSRRHARLFWDADAAAWFVVDEHSSKGTVVCRGSEVLQVRRGDPRGVRLRAGDEIRLGNAVLVFEGPG